MSFFSSRTPLVFAHRGASLVCPENTFSAFDAGISARADGLKLDVQLSADGVVVVHHDLTLERTTNATGPVAAKTASELACVDAAYHFELNGKFPFRGQGCGIPTLAQVLRRYTDLRLIIELKNNAAELGEAVIREVRTADAGERVCVAGFGSRAIQTIRRTMPELATSAHRNEVRLALYRSWIGVPPYKAAYQGYQVPEFAGHIRIVSPRFIRHAHQAGFHVQVWTVDAANDIRRFLNWTVDALISNRPDVAVAARDAWTEVTNKGSLL